MLSSTQRISIALSLLSRIYNGKETQQTENIDSKTFAKCLIIFSFLNLFSPLYLTVLASILGRMQRALEKPRQVKAGYFVMVFWVFFLLNLCVKDILFKHEKERYRESPTYQQVIFRKSVS